MVFNEYQRQFLAMFLDYKVRFLIIGGHARRIHWGENTRDLDIWADIAPAAQSSLEAALLAWTERYRMHSLPRLERPVSFAPRRQIKFPNAPCKYLSQDGNIKDIAVEDGVDVLTSVGEADFAECYQRSVWHTADGFRLRFLSEDDAAKLSPKRS